MGVETVEECEWFELSTMMPRYGIITVATCYRYGRDVDLHIKSEALDMIQHEYHRLLKVSPLYS